MSPKPPEKRDNPRQSALDQSLQRGPDMTRKCAYLLWLAALLLIGGTEASAQTAGTGGSLSSSPANEEGTGLIVSIVKAGGVEFSEQKRLGTPLGLPACVEGSIEVTIAGLPNSPQYPYLEVWYSTGTGACNQADRATRVGTNQNCTKLVSSRDSQQINSFSVLNTTVQIQPVCDLNSDKSGGSRQGPQTLWFLLLRSQGSAEAAQFYRAFTINIDTLPPEEPTNVEAGSGQTDIPLTWDLPLSSTNFYVIADYSEGAAVNDQDGGVADAGAEASGSSDCTSRYIRAGNRFDPNVKVPGLLIRETGSVSTEMSFDGRDFGGVKKVPVAVAAEDLAGNISVLSAVQCLTVTQTTGFWDRYKSPEGGGPGGVAEPGCACSVPGARTSGPRAILVTPVALLLVGAYARRRIRRRAR
jgi:MYXO-CTERM domain-containing protein